MYCAGGMVSSMILHTEHHKSLDDIPQDNNFVNGAVFMIKSHWVTEHGLFAQEFYNWYEDVDLSLRIKEAGFQISTTNKAQVFHIGAATVGSGGFLSLFHKRHIKARNYGYLLKRHGRWHFKSLAILLALTSVVSFPLTVLLSLIRLVWTVVDATLSDIPFDQKLNSASDQSKRFVKSIIFGLIEPITFLHAIFFGILKRDKVNTPKY